MIGNQFRKSAGYHPLLFFGLEFIQARERLSYLPLNSTVPDLLRGFIAVIRWYFSCRIRPALGISKLGNY